MKVNVQQENLLNLISKTQNIVEKRTTMPILSHILLESVGQDLKVYVTDLEVSLTDKIKVDVIKEGKVVVDARRFFQIIKELDSGNINLTSNSKNGYLNISQGKTHIQIVGANLAEYPIFPITYSKNPFYINSEVLKEMIEKTMHSVSNDETRYQINGVYFEQFKISSGIFYKMVSTDGHRLSLITRLAKGEFSEKEDKKISETDSLKPIHDEISQNNEMDHNNDSIDLEDHDYPTHQKTDVKGVIIPRKGLNEIRRLLERDKDDIEISVEGSQLVVRQGNIFLLIRLIEGVFPKYEKFIPNSISKKFKISREKLISSLKLASILTNEKSRSVSLSLSNGIIKIASQNPDLGDIKEEMGINYNGDDLEIGFNVRYLLDVLTSFEEEEVDIGFTHSEAGGIFNPSNDRDYTCVVMPMRL